MGLPRKNALCPIRVARSINNWGAQSTFTKCRIIPGGGGEEKDWKIEFCGSMDVELMNLLITGIVLDKVHWGTRCERRSMSGQYKRED